MDVCLEGNLGGRLGREDWLCGSQWTRCKFGGCPIDMLLAQVSPSHQNGRQRTVPNEVHNRTYSGS